MFIFKKFKKIILNILYILENISEKFFKKKKDIVQEQEFNDYKTAKFNNRIDNIFDQYSESVSSNFKQFKNQENIISMFELRNVSTQLPYSIIIPIYKVFNYIKNSESIKKRIKDYDYVNCKVEIVFISLKNELKQKHVKILCSNNYKSGYFFQNIILIRNFIFSSLLKLLNNYTMDTLISLKITLI